MISHPKPLSLSLSLRNPNSLSLSLNGRERHLSPPGPVRGLPRHPPQPQPPPPQPLPHLAFLQTLVSISGRLQNHHHHNNNILCFSFPSLLAYLSARELLQYNPHDAVSSLWPFDSDSLRLRVEFSLFLETLTSKFKESVESESEPLLVLGKLAEPGFRWLRPDLGFRRRS